MRIIKGWSKDERKDLEWQKKSGNKLDDVIDDLFSDDFPTTYLHDKYNQGNLDPDFYQNTLLDIVDYWRGDAKFPERLYYVHDSGSDFYLCYEPNTGMGVCWLQASHSKKTKQQWLEINPAYEPMLEEVEDDEVEED